MVGAIEEFSNTGTIDAGAGQGLINAGGLFWATDVTTFSNAGTIKGEFGILAGEFGGDRSTFGVFNNTATGEISGTEIGLLAGNTDFTEFTNDGTISASGDGELLALIGSSMSVSLPTGIAGLTGNAAIVSMNSTFGTFTNTKSISSSATGTAAALLSVGTAFDSITNAEDAVMEGEGSGLVMTATLVGGEATSFTNAGSITAEATGTGSLASGFALLGPQIIGISTPGASVGTWKSSGSISAEGDIAMGGLLALSSVDSFSNSGTLEGKGTTLGGGLLLASVDMGDFTNSGTIEGSGAYSGGIAVIGLDAMADNIGDAGLAAALGGSDNPLLSILSGIDEVTLSTPTTIDSFDNSGTISGGLLGLYVGGGASVGDIDNSGTIASGSVGLYVDYGAKIGNLDNSGTVSGPEALAFYGDAEFGTITNSGTIAGDIKNRTDNTLTFIGGTGDAYGLITGYSADPSKLVTGLIDSKDAGVLFQSGNTRLNSDINVGTHSVTNTGNLRIDGQVSITGNYTQSSSGKLVIAATAEEIGKLMVSGTADLTNGTIVIVPIGGYKLAGGVPDVLSAGTLNIDGLTMRAGTDTITYALVVIDGVTQLVANLPDDGPTSDYADIGAGAGDTGAEMGRALDVIASGSTEAAIDFQSSVLVALLGLDDADQPAAIAELAPATDLQSWQMGGLATSLFSGLVSDRQTMRLPGSISATSPVSGYAPSPTQPGADAWASLADGPLADAGSPPQFWAELLGGTAEGTGYGLSGGGMAMGADRVIADDLLVGLAGSFVRVSASPLEAADAASTQTSYQGRLYGSWRPGALHVDAQLGGSFGTTEQSRRIDFLDATASAEFADRGLMVEAEAGYDLSVALADVGSLTITPEAGLAYQSSHYDGYVETGAGAANLSIDAMDLRSVTSRIGASLALTIPADLGAITPALRASWLHDFDTDPIETQGTLAGTPFVVSTDRPAGDGVELGLSLGVKTERLTLGAEYVGEFRNDYTRQSGLLKGIVRF